MLKDRAGGWSRLETDVPAFGEVHWPFYEAAAGVERMTLLNAGWGESETLRLWLDAPAHTVWRRLRYTDFAGLA